MFPLLILFTSYYVFLFLYLYKTIVTKQCIYKIQTWPHFPQNFLLIQFMILRLIQFRWSNSRVTQFSVRSTMCTVSRMTFCGEEGNDLSVPSNKTREKRITYTQRFLHCWDKTRPDSRLIKLILIYRDSSRPSLDISRVRDLHRRRQKLGLVLWLMITMDDKLNGPFIFGDYTVNLFYGVMMPFSRLVLVYEPAIPCFRGFISYVPSVCWKSDRHKDKAACLLFKGKFTWITVYLIKGQTIFFRGS
jgi:hypothetical protein